MYMNGQASCFYFCTTGNPNISSVKSTFVLGGDAMEDIDDLKAGLQKFSSPTGTDTTRELPNLEGPTIEEFINDEEIRKAYSDPELHSLLGNIEKDPVSVQELSKNPKIKNVLKLIEKRFEPYLQEVHQAAGAQSCRQLEASADPAQALSMEHVANAFSKRSDGSPNMFAQAVDQAGGFKNLAKMVDQAGGFQNVTQMLDQGGGIQKMVQMLGQAGGMQNMAEILEQAGGMQNISQMMEQAGGMQNMAQMLDQAGGMENLLEQLKGLDK